MKYELELWTHLLGHPTCTEQGIWSIKRGVGLGVVALIQREDGSVRFIKKAPRPEYEFSGMWALPGGMIRGSADQQLYEALRDSLQKRVLSESGYDLSAALDVKAIRIKPLPVTSYHARGALRHTLILPFITSDDNALLVPASDPSVTDSSWLRPAEILHQLAPANRLIVAWWLWPSLAPGVRGKIRSSVERAWRNCKANANIIGFPLPPVPWERN
ncbi:MAG: NUDIX hydrolase [Candidatus Thiodiazotropha sp.]